jgi:MATE family multidrug resistance protein
MFKKNINTTKTTLLSASKKTARLAIPIVGSQLVNAINLFIAMLLIAQLGHAQLAAGALVSSLSITLSVIAWSMLFSVGVVIGYAFGAEKNNELGLILRSGLLLGTLIGIPVIFIMWHIGPILRFLHQQEQLIILTQKYFHGLVWGILPSIWIVCCSQFVIAIEKAKIVLVLSILSLIFMLIPGYGLLFGVFGLPKIGMAGMAYANAFMSWAIFILIVTYLLQNQFNKYKIFSFNKIFSWTYLKKLFTVGYPISIQFGAELAAFSLSTIFCGWISQASLAAWQIMIQLNMIIIMVPYGLAQASAILVGQALGKNDKPATRPLGHAGLLLGTVFMFTIALVYLSVPKLLISLYLNVHQSAYFNTVHIAVLLLAVAAFSQFFDGIRNISTGILRGFHDTKVPMLVGIMATWIIGIPISYLLAFVFHWGTVGVSMGFMFGVSIGAVILLRRFHKKSIS